MTERFSAAAPEVLGGVAAHPERLGAHVAVEVDVVGRQAEAGDLGEEAEVDVGGVVAGLEQHRVALRAELVGLLLGEDGCSAGSGWSTSACDGSKTKVFGPRFGLRGSVGVDRGLAGAGRRSVVDRLNSHSE